MAYTIISDLVWIVSVNPRVSGRCKVWGLFSPIYYFKPGPIWTRRSMFWLWYLQATISIINSDNPVTFILLLFTFRKSESGDFCSTVSALYNYSIIFNYRNPNWCIFTAAIF